DIRVSANTIRIDRAANGRASRVPRNSEQSRVVSAHAGGSFLAVTRCCETRAHLERRKRSAFAEPDHTRCWVPGAISRIGIQKRCRENELRLVARAMLISNLWHSIP